MGSRVTSPVNSPPSGPASTVSFGPAGVASSAALLRSSVRLTAAPSAGVFREDGSADGVAAGGEDLRETLRTDTAVEREVEGVALLDGEAVDQIGGLTSAALLLCRFGEHVNQGGQGCRLSLDRSSMGGLREAGREEGEGRAEGASDRRCCSGGGPRFTVRDFAGPLGEVTVQG